MLLGACDTSPTKELDDDLGLMLYTIREEIKDNPKFYSILWLKGLLETKKII